MHLRNLITVLSVIGSRKMHELILRMVQYSSLSDGGS